MVHFLRERAAAISEALLAALILVIAAASIGGPAGVFDSARGASSTLSGTAFEDRDRDGSQDSDEPGLGGHQLYLLNEAGTYLGTTVTDPTGAYRFSSLAAGSYQIVYADASWATLRDAWVPSTTGTIYPQATVTVSGDTPLDFGWRAILRSADIATPISTFAAPSGLRVQSYTDAVDARMISDFLHRGLVGTEAPSITVFFGFAVTSSTSTSVAESGGRFSGYAAHVYVSYASWLEDRGMTLSHEYGHGWSLYHATMTQADPSMAAYLAVRGLGADPRVDASYLWNRRELIAEDFRQLLGPADGRSAPQANGDLAAAADVPGLASYLSTTFTSGPGSAPAPSSPPPSAAPTPSLAAPTPGPSSSPPMSDSPSSPSPTPLPTPTPSAALPAISGLSITPTPVRTSARVGFRLSAPALVRLTIVTPAGAVVRALANGVQLDGSVDLVWDRRDDRGRRVKAGPYRLVVEIFGSPVQSLAFRVG